MGLELKAIPRARVRRTVGQARIARLDHDGQQLNDEEEVDLATAVSGGSKSRSELRRFGLTVGLAFLALAGLAGWREHLIVAMVLAGIGGPLVLAALLIPGRLGPVERAWMGLAYAISKVTTPIFMGIVYFLVITPVGMLMRALGRDPLEPPRSEESYWMPYSTPGDPEPYDMQRQF